MIYKKQGLVSQQLLMKLLVFKQREKIVVLVVRWFVPWAQLNFSDPAVKALVQIQAVQRPSGPAACSTVAHAELRPVFFFLMFAFEGFHTFDCCGKQSHV